MVRASSLFIFGLLGQAQVLQAANPEEDSPDHFGTEGDAAGPKLTAAQLSSLFDKIDTSGDKKMHVDEVKAFIHTMKLVEAKAELRETLGDKLINGKIALDKAPALFEGHEEIVAQAAAADVDADGFLTEEELLSLHMPELNKNVLAIVAKEAMSFYDTDNDGKASFAEFEKAEGEFNVDAKINFLDLDKNHDGFVDSSELAVGETGKFHDEKAMVHMLQAADKDKDGYVTSQELQDAYEQISEDDSVEMSQAHDQLLRWSERMEL